MPRKPAPDIDFIRKFLKGYDDGILQEGEVVHRVLHHLLEPHLNYVETHGESMTATSWCGAEPPPPKRAIVELGHSHVRFTKVP